MASVQIALMAYLDRAARYAFEYGQHDCMLEVADWIDYACKTNLAYPWRGKYTSEAELDALMAPLGGLEAAMRAEAVTAGLEEAPQPQTGDVALLTLVGQPKPLGAILMPTGRWRIKTQTGIVLTRGVTVVVAWGLPCRS